MCFIHTWMLPFDITCQCKPEKECQDQLKVSMNHSENTITFNSHKGFPGGAEIKSVCLQCRRSWFDSWVRKMSWRRARRPTLVFLVFLKGSAHKESACNAGDLDSMPGLGRSPGEGKATHYSILAWRIPWSIPWGHKETWLRDFQRRQEITHLSLDN